MGSVFHGYMCILIYIKCIHFSSVAKIYSQLEEGEWDQSAMGIYTFCYISHLCSVMVLHRSVVD